MAITPTEQLQEAERCLSEAEAEIDLRKAASLAYYAAYHSLLPLAASLKSQFVYSGGVHAQLIAVLIDSKDMRHRALGYMLREARDRRSQADYNLSSDFSRGDAEIQIRNVRKLLAKLAELDALAAGAKTA